METVKVDCDRCDNHSGYTRCTGCTRGPRDVVLKCCGRCDPLGKIKCYACSGKGKRDIKQKCTARTHSG
jgi:hypothetical protein